MRNFSRKIIKLGSLFSAAAVLFTPLTTLANDVIETVTVGEILSSTSSVYSKKFVDGQTIYGLQRVQDSNGGFVKFLAAISTDDEATWSAPVTVLTAADLANAGPDSSDDYSQSILRSIQWFQCPGTGNMTIWAKRHGIDNNGNLVVKKELLRATILGANKLPTDSYTDSIIINQPFGYSSGDLGRLQENGTAYIISSATTEGKLNILELNHDCSDIAGSGPVASLSWNNSDGSEDHREAPSIFKKDNTFFLTTSGKTSWRPNQQKYSYAQFLTGPWSDLKNMGDSTGYHSQLFFTKPITATDGSGASARVFSATRNAATWNGSDSRKIWMPLYFNDATTLETNYYDYIEINHTKGTVKGFQLDHGTNLTIDSVQVDGHGDNASHLIDGNLSTAWVNNNSANKTSVTFDLGSEQLVKGIKLKQFDFYSDVSLRTPRLKVEVGDGTSFTQVFEDIVGSITWLQSIDVADTLGRYVRLSLIENHNGNNSNTTNEFGFYEVEIWGGDANSTPIIDTDFEGDSVSSEPSDWTVASGTGTSTQVVTDTSQVVRLQDNSSSARTIMSQNFTPQKGTEVVVSYDMKFSDLGNGEYVRLLGDGKLLVSIVSSTVHNSLSFSDKDFNDTSVANILTDTWYTVRLVLNTDAQTYDIYLDDALVWGGARFANDASQIDELKIGTSKSKAGGTLFIDNVRLDGPIVEGGSNGDGNGDGSGNGELFSDDFETANSLWTSAGGTWQRTSDGSQVFRNTTTSNDRVKAGDSTWSNYSVQADVKREGKGAAVLGRYNGSNSYYQLMIYNSNSYKLSRNINNSWILLGSGSFVNNDSTYYQLKLDFNGSTITASIDGQVVESVNDSGISSGAVGLRAVNGTANFDNVVVTEN